MIPQLNPQSSVQFQTQIGTVHQARTWFRPSPTGAVEPNQLTAPVPFRCRPFQNRRLRLRHVAPASARTGSRGTVRSATDGPDCVVAAASGLLPVGTHLPRRQRTPPPAPLTCPQRLPRGLPPGFISSPLPSCALLSSPPALKRLKTRERRHCYFHRTFAVGDPQWLLSTPGASLNLRQPRSTTHPCSVLLQEAAVVDPGCSAAGHRRRASPVALQPLRHLHRAPRPPGVLDNP